MNLYQIFSANLQARMTAAGCSQSMLARQSGYSSSYVHRVLSGIQQNPTLAFVERVAAVLVTTPQAMLQP